MKFSCFGQFLCPSSGLFTVHTALVYVIQVCWQLVSRSICSCSQAVCKLVWHIPLPRVQWKTPNDGQRNCPKHVAFHSKNKFEKLVHLVGFIVGIGHYYTSNYPTKLFMKTLLESLWLGIDGSLPCFIHYFSKIFP